MRRRMMVLGVTPFFCLSATAPRQVIGFGGISPVRTGMTLAQAAHVLHASLFIERHPDEGPNGCGYAHVQGRRDPVHYMFENGRIRRADLDIDGPTTSIRTAENIGVGSSIAEIKRAYGRRVKSYPDAYNQPEPDFEVTSADGKSAIIFETLSGRVTEIRAGQLPWARYIEGCS